MRPVASLLAQCHVVSNIDWFLKIPCSQKNRLCSQTKEMDVPQLIQDACFG